MVIQDTYRFNKVYEGNVEELQEELSHISLENIRKLKAYESKLDDFYSMWLRFGPEAARTILIPYIWDGRLPSPKQVL